MKKIVVIFVLIFGVSFSQITKRKLVWEENFNGSQLDEEVWNFELGNGCPNNCKFF